MSGLFKRLAMQQLGRRPGTLSAVQLPRFEYQPVEQPQPERERQNAVHYPETGSPEAPREKTDMSNADIKPPQVSLGPESSDIHQTGPAREKQGSKKTLVPAIEPEPKPALSVKIPSSEITHQADRLIPVPLQAESGESIDPRPNDSHIGPVEDAVPTPANINQAAADDRPIVSIMPVAKPPAARVDTTIPDIVKAAAVSPSAHTEQDVTVNVTIGRIEVKAISEKNQNIPAAKPVSRRKPVMTLDEYQARRLRGER